MALEEDLSDLNDYHTITTNAVKRINITRINAGEQMELLDALAIEEPLQINIGFNTASEKIEKNIAVTMRTPGNDAELATGFLFTEGIIKNIDDVLTAEHQFIACAENKENVIQIKLKQGASPNLHNTERNFYTTSSCGVCGKGSINAIRTISAYPNLHQDQNNIDATVLYQLPAILQQQQAIFADTGGLHASALFDNKGNLMIVREDVGRHNALDKLIGAALTQNLLPLNKHMLLLSGRASFELIQKAAMAGINIIAAVGAPSSLAVELATEFNITLVGFLRNKRFNIYTAANRILLPIHETTN